MSRRDLLQAFRAEGPLCHAIMRSAHRNHCHSGAAVDELTRVAVPPLHSAPPSKYCTCVLYCTFLPTPDLQEPGSLLGCWLKWMFIGSRDEHALVLATSRIPVSPPILPWSARYCGLPDRISRRAVSPDCLPPGAANATHPPRRVISSRPIDIPPSINGDLTVSRPPACL